MSRADAAPAGTPRGGAGRLLAVLTVATLLQWLGSFAIAPLLPLYLQGRDVPAAGIGVVMAAFFLGALLSQYLAGRASAIHGHRVVLLVGLAGYAAGCLGLYLSTGVEAASAARVLQGAGAGAFEVATLTAVATAVAPGMRGRAFSAVYTGQLLGVTIGPLFGGLAGEKHLDALFLASGAAGVLASLPVLWLLPATVLATTTGAGGAGVRRGLPDDRDPPRGRSRVWSRAGRLLTPGMAGLLVVAASDGLTSGVYETCWSLLMRREGMSTAVIGLTFTLFGLPYLLFAWPAGWLVDHHDRRVLVVVSVALRAAAVASYPFLPVLSVILLVGCLEGVLLSVSRPAAQSLLAQESATAGLAGRGQGLFATTQTATTVVASVASGALFAVDHRLPFVLAAASLLASALVVPMLWRAVAGTDRPVPAPLSPGGQLLSDGNAAGL
ncbi:MFS transporter [Frankia sp. AgKG'84/4]|uniref:MFS transporter n=1 Tax=Frankia sp. AgKG'84/4 TaxID=573490 RepID=UPI00200E59A0|nr:MFS transporter [Frankia sp. AgKG'84/4]MCL9793725.1 MFS transporter [Frankia sp. AgKG'84/4]